MFKYNVNNNTYSKTKLIAAVFSYESSNVYCDWSDIQSNLSNVNPYNYKTIITQMPL